MGHEGINRRQMLGVSAAVLGAACAAPAAGADAARPLDGTTILITGAASGFGRLGAEHYARLGARVFASMRNLPRPEAAGLEKLAAEEGLAIEVVEIDVTSDASVADGVAAVLAKTGGTLDVLVNNAGIGLGGPVEVQDMEATKLLFETNVFGAHRMARAVLPAMRAAKKGQIFQLSSQLGRVIVPGLGHYSPTKFALEALSEGLAYELVPHGIEVTIIQPGGYPTEIWAKSTSRAAALKARTPQDLLDAYPQMTAGMGEPGSGGGSTDPMDVPRSIAEIIQMPRGTRPLRRPVHPGAKPQEAINDVSRQAQLAMLGASAYGPWVKDVLD
ncbi:SDR family oxidoreductase [Hyphomonas sp.]|jgi:NAD(P)-dependent dehydrogenase (short-subunit alcohol dehydrogenase family)|uniref:SDR family oxidoreductase n=1 Tax=Hyphomonas sp. TaxID=87 RepID=UPI0025C47033|nr:SDR family oxidoreductase [Hyphomonas sp.]